MEERRLTRKEPVDIYIPSIDGNVKLSPVPWRARGDLGNLIQSEFRGALDKAREVNGDFQSSYNYLPVLKLGTTLTEEQIESLYFDEVIAICRWLVELNGLDALLWMLDPEAQGPQIPEETGAEQADGEKTSSTDDSSSLESPPET